MPSKSPSALRVAVTGAAGLVGQNLVPRLKARGFTDIVAVDKHRANTATLRRLHPDVTVVEADLARDDGWQEAVASTDVLVVLHAQIGGLDHDVFVANNVTATERLLAAVAGHRPYVVHVSSSVVNSAADDWYVETKDAQEKLVLASGLDGVVLRPTLMFGWFDRKHIGWLARFMRKAPVFPIPGDGRYLRQPLYAGDFSDIVMACIERRPSGTFNISGLERIDYIDLMRAVKQASGAKAAIVRIPYGLFWALLWVYARVDGDPPFTTRQLEALVTPDVFEVIDWPGLFGVTATPLNAALEETFRDPVYSDVVLEF
ncbi:NAD-dependent epimerase/dehydratase family protein [Rhodoplanes roseus]|uniref:NAD-dependent dehydratase n=1 Tax=Rhodoplanes roseus TaxID=29409 RepID=A0A327KXN8_9BRAD|nr:NAD(P)-dependent oxidoreductase [Rhodoplanes roseus]RAI43031.1 NAD-dependent dehydratase [Rhodoplanes roseus]